MKIRDFITLTPGRQPPFHLSRLCDAIDEIGKEPQRRIFWHSPRCGLTDTLVACMTLRHELTFGYAAASKELTNRICSPTGAVPADRLCAGTSVSGAMFIDGYVPGPQQWSWIKTRIIEQASIFIFVEPCQRDIENLRGEFIAATVSEGFTIGWA